MDYNKQANDFLLSCNVEFKAEKAVPQLTPNWAKDGKHGTHYIITLTRYEKAERADRQIAGEKTIYNFPVKSIQFSFWNSIHAKEQAERSYNKSDKPKAYDVLASIYFPTDTFNNFCDTFGYDNDSRTAERAYNETVELNAKIESIFSSDELEKLQEIN